MKHIYNFFNFLNENKVFFSAVYNPVRKTVKALTNDEQKKAFRKFEDLKKINTPKGDLQSLFKNNMAIFKAPADFLKWLDYTIAEPFYNDKKISAFNYSVDNYYLYKFSEQKQLKDYFKVSTGSLWCTRTRSYYKTHISGDDVRETGFYVLVNNNIKDTRDPLYKVYIKIYKSENVSPSIADMYNTYLDHEGLTKFLTTVPDAIKWDMQLFKF